MESERREDLAVRPARSRDEIEAAAKLLGVEGPTDLALDLESDPKGVYVLVAGEEVKGALAYRGESWEIGAAKLEVARVRWCTGEVGEGAFRRTGRRADFDALVSAWSESLPGAGYHLAYVHGAMSLWPVHGFYPSFYHPRVHVPTAKALRLKTSYKVRSVMTRDAPAIERLMARYREYRPRVFAAGVPNFHHYVVEGPGREVYGYFSMNVDGSGQPPVFLPEVEAEDREAAETILAHVAPAAKDRGMRAFHFCLAAEHPFAAVCLDLGGYYLVRGMTRDITLDEEMVRVVDVAGAMRALEPEFAARLAPGLGPSEARDFVLVVDEDRVALRFSRDALVVIPEPADAPEVRMPRFAFTQMLMGYRAPLDLRRGTIHPAAGARLLEPLFPRSWPISLCDHDLWDASLRDPERYSDAAMEEIRKLRYAF